jgi:hypothetical protein
MKSLCLECNRAIWQWSSCGEKGNQTELLMEWLQNLVDCSSRESIHASSVYPQTAVFSRYNVQMSIIITSNIIITTITNIKSVIMSITIFFLLWPYSPNSGLGLPPGNSPFHFRFLYLRQSVGLLGWVISSSQGLYLYTNTEKRTHTHKY